MRVVERNEEWTSCELLGLKTVVQLDWMPCTAMLACRSLDIASEFMGESNDSPSKFALPEKRT
jgi:hypothetical protein